MAKLKKTLTAEEALLEVGNAEDAELIYRVRRADSTEAGHFTCPNEALEYAETLPQKGTVVVEIR